MKALLFIFAFSFFLSGAFCQQGANVDPLTGKLQLGIPIAQLTSGSITVPVAVVYNGGGIKVSEAGGTVGVGWNLEAGGEVTREIRGLPDEYTATNDARKGWLATTNRQAVASFAPTADSGCSDWSAFSQFTGLNDTEPDIFYFNAPGLNGKFIFDNDGVIRPLPYQDLKFRHVLATVGGVQVITLIEITNNLGVKYTFAQADAATRRPWNGSELTYFDRDYQLFFSSPYHLSKWFNNLWHLTSITGAFGETVSFSYTDAVETSGRKFGRQVKGDLTTIDTLFTVDDLSAHRRLSSIEATSATVNFSWTYNQLLQVLALFPPNHSGILHSGIPWLKIQMKLAFRMVCQAAVTTLPRSYRRITATPCLPIDLNITVLSFCHTKEITR